MSPSKSLPHFTFLLLFAVVFTSAGDETPTAYDVLRRYGFPVGILPQGVTGYELNSETGQFKAYLEKSCKFSIDSYHIEYESTISGVISPQKLSKLKGVSVKVLLLWLSIVEVDKDGDELAFSVGIASAKFSTEGFDESPQCGCGFDCVNGGSRVRVADNEEGNGLVGNTVASS